MQKFEDIGSDRKQILVKNLTESDVKSLVKDKNLLTLQSERLPSRTTLQLLDKHLFSKRPEVTLRFYHFHESLASLAGLKKLHHLDIEEDYSNPRPLDMNHLKGLKQLKTLSLTLNRIKDLSFLEALTNMESLSLSSKNSTKVSLDVLAKLALKRLELDKLANIKTLPRLKTLKSLAIASTPLSKEDIQAIVNQSQLEKFSYYGTTKVRLDWLDKMKNIKILRLKNCLIDTISWVGKLKKLEELDLSYLPRITALPSFKGTKNLKKIAIFELKHLKNISTLPEAKNLKEFRLNQTKNSKPSDFLMLKKLIHLKKANVHFGSEKLDGEFDQLLKTLKLKRY